MSLRCLIVLLIGFLGAVPALAQPAPTGLRVEPANFKLHGPRAGLQLLASDAAGDVTRKVRWRVADPGVVEVGSDGYARPRGNGTTTVRAEIGGQSAEVRLTVAAFESSAPVGFRDEIIPVLNRAGCNQGACHGTPNGKGGFKLSLRGYDVPFDYGVLTREAGGRRTNRQQPDSSLILQKGLAQVSHQGGQRLVLGSPEHQLLRQWIVEGLPDDSAGSATLVKLEVHPPARTLRLDVSADRHQQLLVLGHFSDGTMRDVTRLSAFSTSNDDIATVSSTGLVKPETRGEVVVLARYQHAIVSARFTFLQDVPGFVWPNPPEHNFIDKHINAKLKLLQIPPSDLCNDAEFLRRAHLDLLGVLPTPDEVRLFLKDKQPDRRARLIDRLLERPEFADYWTLKWADVLRLSEKFMDEGGVRDFHAWIRKHVADDRPLDGFVRDLLTGTGDGKDNPQVHFFRPMVGAEERAETVSQLFLGVRMNCAKCHNHPFERWTQEDYYGLAAVFAQVAPQGGGKKGKFTLKVNAGGKVLHPRTNLPMAPRLPGGGDLAIRDGQDRRAAFADWLVRPENPFFARALANRLWFHLMGRGIVEPVDDFRDSNPPVNDALLDALAAEFARQEFRLKPLLRTIVLSRTYQLSARPNALNKQDNLYYSRANVRMLAAEPLLDALSAFTLVPESFPGMQRGTRAMQLPGAKIDHPFLRTFHRPLRTLACECERERDANLSQALQLIAGKLLQDKLQDDRGRIALLVKGEPDDAKIIEELYLAALSRFPTERERLGLLAAARDAENRREFFEDLGWSLVNSKEFQF